MFSDIFLDFLGNLSKLRRSSAASTDNGRAHTTMLQTILMKVTKTEERTRILEENDKEREIRGKVERFNIKPYFPATSLTLIEDFLSNKDGNFKEKKEEFEVYLYSVCTLDMDMDSFCAGLLKILFKKDFIRDHRWPTSE